MYPTVVWNADGDLIDSPRQITKQQTKEKIHFSDAQFLQEVCRVSHIKLYDKRHHMPYSSTLPEGPTLGNEVHRRPCLVHYTVNSVNLPSDVTRYTSSRKQQQGSLVMCCTNISMRVFREENFKTLDTRFSTGPWRPEESEGLPTRWPVNIFGTWSRTKFGKQYILANPHEHPVLSTSTLRYLTSSLCITMRVNRF